MKSMYTFVLAILIPATTYGFAQKGVSVTIINDTIQSVMAHHTPGSGAEVMICTRIKPNQTKTLSDIHPNSLDITDNYAFFGEKLEDQESEPKVILNRVCELYRNGEVMGRFEFCQTLPTLQNGDVILVICTSC